MDSSALWVHQKDLVWVRCLRLALVGILVENENAIEFRCGGGIRSSSHALHLGSSVELRMSLLGVVLRPAPGPILHEELEDCDDDAPNAPPMAPMIAGTIGRSRSPP